MVGESMKKNHISKNKYAKISFEIKLDDKMLFKFKKQ